MKCTGIGGIFLVSVSIILLVGCTTLEKEFYSLQTKSAPAFKNTLLIYGISLSLPPGWSFFPPHKTDLPDTLFCFENKTGSVTGRFFRIFLLKEKNIKMKDILSLFAKSTGRYEIEKETVKTVINGRRVSIIGFYHSVDSVYALYAFITFPERMDIIEVVSIVGEEEKEALLEIFSQIIGSYSPERAGVCLRKKANPPFFYGVDNAWIWYSDYRDGFYLRGKINGKDAFMGVWSTEAKDTRQLYEENPRFDISPFKAAFVINNRKIDTEGTGFTDNSGIRKIFYIIEVSRQKYCLYIGISPETEVDPTTLHRNVNVRRFFRYYVSLE